MKITKEQINEMKKLKAEGKGIYQIAKKMGLKYLTVAYYIGGYKQKITNLTKSKRMLNYAQDIVRTKYDYIYTSVVPLKGTPTDLGNGMERWEYKIFIGEDEPRTEEYINIIKAKNARMKESKYEIIDKE
jgi:hypothetical protein